MADVVFINGFNNYVASPLQDLEKSYKANAPLWVQDMISGVGFILNDVKLGFPQKLSLKPVAALGQFFEHHKVEGLKVVRKYAHQGAKVAKYLSPFQIFANFSFHLSELSKPIDQAQAGLKRKVVCEVDGKMKEGTISMSLNWLLLKKMSYLFSFACFLGGYVFNKGSSSLIGRAYPWVSVAAGFGMGAQAIWEDYTVCTSKATVLQGEGAPAVKDAVSKEWWYSTLGIVSNFAVCLIHTLGAGILYYDGHKTLESTKIALSMVTAGLAGTHYIAGAYMKAWRERVTEKSKSE